MQIPPLFPAMLALRQTAPVQFAGRFGTGDIEFLLAEILSIIYNHVKWILDHNSEVNI